ncbi:MAG: hypothetical protein JWO36_818 [Myxococcales bacterium]|nr:hypothetical protein [Myxococcales bacterium]
MRVTSSIVLCAALCGVASAEPFTEGQIIKVEVTGQNDTATVTTMPWCPPGKYTGDSWDIQRLRRTISGYEDYDNWAEAAVHFCEHKEDPSWHKQATGLVQLWMNSSSKTQEEAEAAIIKKIEKLRIEKENEGKPKTDEQKLAFTAHELVELKPNDGVDQAKITDKPAWCDAAGKFEGNDIWEAGHIHRTFESKYGIEGVVQAALHICQRPTDATWKVQAGYILQRWMNSTHLSQPDAERSLRARIQVGKFETQRTALCTSLEVNPEIGGEAKTYGEARRDFFGCNNSAQTLWQDRSQMNSGGVGFYLDGDTQTDELMRAYWLFGYVRSPFGKTLPSTDAGENLSLLYYAIAQNDFAKLDSSVIDKMLSAAPYNDYARIVALETVSVLKAEQKAYEKAVEKMTKGDADYLEILRTAPKKGLAQWDKLAEQWKPEIERSNAFEKLLSQPSRKALKGCSVELFKDGEKLVKSFKTNIYKDLSEKLGADPVASLTLSRLALCYAADKVWGASGALRDVVGHGREMRGPRSLAYYAVVDAVADAKKDRPRLLFDLSGFFQGGGALSGNTNFDSKDFDFNGHAPSEWEQSGTKGVVASTKKVEDGLEIVFKKVTLKWPDYDCVDDIHHPLKVNSDGRIEYYQNCKATGKVSTQDATPNSIVISPLLAAGVKPGVFVQFAEVSTKAKNGDPFAVVVFTKAKADDKKINTFFGFGL